MHSLFKRPGAKRLGPGGFACPCCAPQRDREYRNQMKRAANKRTRQLTHFIVDEQLRAAEQFLSVEEAANILQMFDASGWSPVANRYARARGRFRTREQIKQTQDDIIALAAQFAPPAPYDHFTHLNLDPQVRDVCALINAYKQHSRDYDEYLEDLARQDYEEYDSYDDWESSCDWHNSPVEVAFRSVWGPAEQDEINPDDTVWRYWNDGGWDVIHLRWDADEQKYFATSRHSLVSMAHPVEYDHTHTPEQIMASIAMALRMEGIE